MHPYRVMTSVLILLLLPLSEAIAEEGYFAENPGLDFYSKIDDGNFVISQKILTRRLQKNPTLDTFGKICLQNEWLKDAPTDIKTLESIENGDYSVLSKILKNNNIKSPSTEAYQALALCLTNLYQEQKSRARDEQSNLEKLSSLGLYMDGDTSNSDYDILADIMKINNLIFSRNIKYNGVTNTSASSFRNFISGNAVDALFGSTTPPGIAGNLGTNNGENATNGTQAAPGAGRSLSEIIGGTCISPGGSTGIQDVDNILDDDFRRDYLAALATGPNTSVGQGMTARAGGRGENPNAPGTSPTSANDFFHTMPCTSIFCIKINFVAGSHNLLSGGKNVSIEGLLDKHIDILEPIAASSLRSEKMTNNFGGFPAFDVILKKILAGARVQIGGSAQKARRDKREQDASDDAKNKATEKGNTARTRDDREFSDIQRCAFANAGINTDLSRSNGFLGAGYSTTTATNTENISTFEKNLGPQNVENERYSGCLSKNIDLGRKTYYDSFSTDLTEIQAFSDAMLDEIKAIIDIGISLKNKPVK